MSLLEEVKYNIKITRKDQIDSKGGVSLNESVNVHTNVLTKSSQWFKTSQMVQHLLPPSKERSKNCTSIPMHDTHLK